VAATLRQQPKADRQLPGIATMESTTRAANKNTVSMDVPKREAGGSRAERRERRRGERRHHVLRALLHGSFEPRRRVPRRSDDRVPSNLDWHHPQWLAVAVLIVACCCIDAFLTLLLISRGAYEANPFMVALVAGSPVTFALVKIGVTTAGVVLLTQLARLKTFGRVPVGLLLYTVMALYAALIAYEFSLLGKL
jgi:hypothetical protein